MADDVPTSQESMAAEAPVPQTPQAAVAPQAAAVVDAPETPQHTPSKSQGEEKEAQDGEKEASPKGTGVGNETSIRSGSGKEGKKGVKASPQVKESPEMHPGSGEKGGKKRVKVSKLSTKSLQNRPSQVCP